MRMFTNAIQELYNKSLPRIPKFKISTLKCIKVIQQDINN